VHVLLETERLRLRRFTAADVDLLVDLDSDPAVMAWITGGRPTPREEIEQEVLPAFLAHYERLGGLGFWAADLRDGGDFTGWFHLRPERGAPPGEVELGYRLRAAYWGRGLATEGSRALVDAGFERFGAQRITANTMTVNTASRRVMEKAGLRLIRTYHAQWPDRIEGDEHGDVEYALTRPEWQASRTGA